MALITRLNRLFQADMHALLDRIEEPQAVLRQAIREMEQALAEDRRRAALLRREARRVADREAELAAAADELDTSLDLCLEAGDDELARPVVRRTLENRRLRAVLGRKRTELEREAADLETRLDARAGELERIRREAEFAVGEDPDRPPAEALWETDRMPIGNQEVEVALLREKRARSGS